MKINVLLLLFIINSTFTGCSLFSQKDPEIQIDNIKSKLEEGKTPIEKQQLKKALKVLEISSLREKANYPKKYDMKMSAEELFIKIVQGKSFVEVIQLSHDYIEKQAARIKLLEKEIAKRRISKTNLNDKDTIAITDFKITSINDEFYINALVTDSSSINEEKTYFFNIDIYLTSNNKVIDTVGFGAKGLGIIFTKDNNQTIQSRVSDTLKQYLLSLENAKFPMEIVSDFKLGINTYASIFTKECRGFSPLKDDPVENKTLEELKKDLMRFKELKYNLDTIETSL